MTLNSLEVTNYCKNLFIHLFIAFIILYFYVFIYFIIIFGQTCYGTTVPKRHGSKRDWTMFSQYDISIDLKVNMIERT